MLVCPINLSRGWEFPRFLPQSGVFGGVRCRWGTVSVSNLPARVFTLGIVHRHVRQTPDHIPSMSEMRLSPLGTMRPRSRVSSLNAEGPGTRIDVCTETQCIDTANSPHKAALILLDGGVHVGRPQSIRRVGPIRIGDEIIWSFYAIVDYPT